MNVEVSTAAVILAAGSSSRMGGVKKEYHSLGNSTVLAKAVSAFAAVSSVQTIIIAVSPNTEDSARSALPAEYLCAIKPKIFFVDGGKTRSASVLNALLFLAGSNHRYVLIHDGARPWVSPLLIENIIEAVKKHDAVIPLIAVTDTPKLVTENREQGIKSEEREIFISQHLKRPNVGLAQTPQAFKFPEILYAHEKAAKVDEEFTDDAEIWGRFCGQVAVIAGEPENRKITFPEDLV